MTTTTDIPSLFSNSTDPGEVDDVDYRLHSFRNLDHHDNDHDNDDNDVITSIHPPPPEGWKGCPLRGPSVHYLETQFSIEIQNAGFDPSKHTLHDIYDVVIRNVTRDLHCPRDGWEGCAYVDAIGNDGYDDDDDEYAGRATFLISYTYNCVVENLISSLVEYTHHQGLDPKRTYVWIDSLCINQHRVQEAKDKGQKEILQVEEFVGIFQDRMERIGHVLAIMDPWDDPLYIKRVWCLYELYTAIALGVNNIDDDEEEEDDGEWGDKRCNFDIIMPMEEARDFETSISNGNIQKLWDTFQSINIENAHASVEQDRINIFQALETGGPGFDNLNDTVREHLQTWLIEFSEGHVREDLKSCRDLEKSAIACDHVADLSIGKGDLSRAQTLLSDALQILEDNGETLSAAFLARKLGVSKRIRGDLRGALETYNKAIELHVLTTTMDTEDCANVYMSRGDIHSELNELEKAFESYNESCNILLSIDKLESDKGALLLTNKGAVQTKMMKFTEAMDTFNEATRVRQLTNTTASPNGAFLLDNIALVKGELQEFDAAINQYKEARRLRDTLGTHRSMDGALHLAGFGRLFLNMGDLKNALEHFEEAVNIHKELDTLEKPEGVEVVEATIQCQSAIEYVNNTSTIFQLNEQTRDSYASTLLDTNTCFADSPEWIQIACGERHTAGLTKKHEVFTWGHNNYGQLGHGDYATIRRVPTRVESLDGLVITNISCGEYHTAALTDKGEVFTWGYGSYGLLGHNNEDCHFSPKKVEALVDEVIVKVSCGGYRTCAVTSTGSIYMWGWRIGTEYGKGYTLLFNPKLLQDLSFNGVVSVSANFNHTACVTKSGEVFTWGYGYYGRLGHGDYGKLGHHGQETNEESPKRVEALVGVKAKLMSCGRNHTAVCTVDGDVYTFGRSDFGQDMEIKRTRPPLY